MVTAGLVALAVVAQAGADLPSAEAPAPSPPAAAPQPAAEPTLPPPPLSAEPPPPLRRYGDKGSVELGLGLTYSSEAGFAAAGSARYYVVDGVAPGVEATFVAGGTASSRYGLLLGALRVVPVRVSSIAFALTGRAGRVFVGDHADGWGLGGAASVLFMFSPTVGLELGYETLWLVPHTFCADLGGCTIRGPIIAVRFGF